MNAEPISENVAVLDKICPLQQDYLAEIYQASYIEQVDDSGFVACANLAERLLTSQSTVNRVIDCLRNAALIEHQRYVGVQLTTRGQQEALKVLRRQAIIEVFLVSVMHFGWHEIYDEARQMRHTISDPVLMRMWELAGRPACSPFGEWIDQPPAAQNDDIALAYADIQQDYTIVRILTRLTDRLEYLSALGFGPGVRLRLLHKAPFNGPLQIQLGHEYRIIGHELAKMMTVILSESTQ